jgi:hypothetical protein
LRSVAKEDLTPVGDVPTEFDSVGVHPCVKKLASGDEPEVESRAVTPIRGNGVLHAREVLRYLGPHLISLFGNRWTDKGVSRARVETFQGSRDDSDLKAAPTSVHHGDPAGRSIDEGQWHAIGDEYGEREIRGVDEEGVRFARVSDLCPVKHGCAMDLAGGDEVISINAGRASDEGSVLAHAVLVVTHVVAKVQ